MFLSPFTVVEVDAFARLDFVLSAQVQIDTMGKKVLMEEFMGQ